MRKLLVIAYSFPPVAVRSHRIVKFVKHLHGFGWWPVVMTPRRPHAPEMDDGLVAETGHYSMTVHRTPSLEPVALIERMKGGRFWVDARQGREGRRFRLLRWLHANLAVPDSRIGWVPSAVLTGWRVIRRERIDAMLVSVEPYSSLLAALALKRLTGRPLFIDFRDEWITGARYRSPEKLGVVVAFERWLERRVIASADVVITVTPESRDNFQRRYARTAARFVCIPNGWDPDDFTGPPPAPAPTLTITHAGTLYRSRFPEAVFTALGGLLDERPALRGRVRVVLVGTIAHDLADSLRRFPYPEALDIRGQRSAAEARALMRASDILLLQEESDEDVAALSVPMKLYDYLGAQRFVLALAGPGPIRNLVEHVDAGAVIAPTDVAAVRALLLDWLEGRRRDPVIDEEGRRRRLQFTSLAHTARLAEWLDGVTKTR